MYTINKARRIFPETRTADAVPAITARFKLLTAEDQLALIWFAYLEMGKTITVAAPGAARMELARPTLEEILAMSHDEQTKVMCDLAAKINTPISSRYAFWSTTSSSASGTSREFMTRQVAPIPAGYPYNRCINSPPSRKPSRVSRSLCCAILWWVRPECE